MFVNGGFTIHRIVADQIIPAGNHLVYLFILLGGFGISRGYYKRFLQKKINLKDFYKSRYQKTFPFLAVFILLIVIVDLFISSIMEWLIEAFTVFGIISNNVLNVP